MALRYFYLTAHYRDSLNFTWDALRSSQKALDNLRNIILEVKSSKKRPSLSPEKLHKVDDFRNSFIHSLEDDINTPQALATLWNMLKSNIPSEDKYDTALYFDEVLGLNLAGIKQLVKKEIKTPSGDVIITPVNLSTATISRIEERNVLRAHGKFGEADQKRIEINRVDNIAVQDTAMGTVVSPLKK
ncbi:hypothetical protein A3E41_04270 [Candidatus Woesebacteria bacterium RIFCSPHIGHO2_12_FULL_38_9]|nr:MAG: hypothetical protein A3E41_04270 [Candidatus Woesebacteria bacterium RIFCSPHIGHO2_12_FULL_38_9]